MTLSELNVAPVDEGRNILLECCGSRAWADRLIALRPFQTQTELFWNAENEWRALDEQHWLEAFSKHPQIGARSGASAWASQEQSGMARANVATTETMQQRNREYLQKFGWIYIVCATGKSGEEMVDNIERRLSHGASDELRIAAAEQAKIMHIRLEKLLNA